MNETPRSRAARLAGKLSGSTLLLVGSGTVAAIVVITAVVTVAIKSHQREQTRAASTAVGVQLDGLLLDADAINASMHTSGMTATSTTRNLWSSQPPSAFTASHTNCLSVAEAAESEAYAESHYTDMRGQSLTLHETAYVSQNVVALPSKAAATAFYATLSKSWAACANNKVTETDAAKSTTVWSVGPLSDQNGYLSIAATKVIFSTWTLQRALTVCNNVVIDVDTTSYTPSSQLAVAIAWQIAARAH